MRPPPYQTISELRQKAILDIARARPGVKVQDVAREMGLEVSAVRDQIRALAQRGFLRVERNLSGEGGAKNGHVVFAVDGALLPRERGALYWNPTASTMPRAMEA